MFPRTEMLDLVLVDGHAKGIIVRDLNTGEITSHSADAVLLCTGGYGNVFYLSTNARGCNVTATFRAHKRGALFANPCFTQIHPTCIPVSGDYQSKLTLMSESLRNDGRIWVPKRKEDCGKEPSSIPEADRDYFLERKYPSYGNLAPRDISSRSAKEACDEGRGVGPGGLGVYLDFADAIKRLGQKTIEERYGNLAPRDISSRSAKEACDEGRGVGPGGLGVYLDFADAIKRLGQKTIEERYGNLFEMYQNITGENAYERPMRIYPAVHYTMGGLWVDYNLMSNIPGLHVLGEANFSDHGANRLGASALMQGLADGYFVIPYTLGNYLTTQFGKKVDTNHPAFEQALKETKAHVQRLIDIKGTRSVDSFHRELGLIIWDYCGMARSAEGLTEAIGKIQKLRKEFWSDLKLIGGADGINMELERAGRVADFLEFGELMCLDALTRDESCGGHFRTEHQSPEGEALRNDEQFSFVSAWKYEGEGNTSTLIKEPLVYEQVKPSTRSYK
jgi:succinate dehydrogenase / fumarate reductase flavoprotein subunit